MAMMFPLPLSTPRFNIGKSCFELGPLTPSKFFLCGTTGVRPDKIAGNNNCNEYEYADEDFFHSFIFVDSRACFLLNFLVVLYIKKDINM